MPVPYWIDPCPQPGFETSPRLEHHRSQRVVLIVVLVFTCGLIQHGYSLDTALLCAACVGVFAGEVAHRVVDPVRRRFRR